MVRKLGSVFHMAGAMTWKLRLRSSVAVTLSLTSGRRNQVGKQLVRIHR